MTCFYRILDVDPAATFSEIKSAYRKKAMTCHPDRGGTHAAMVKVNEAWEVLSNSELRKQYDLMRKQGKGVDGQFADARNRAQSYPKTWDQFDQWLDVIGRDFTDANYGSTKFAGFNIPTGGNSLSGWMFILGGGLLGLCLADILYPALVPEPKPMSSLFGDGIFLPPKKHNPMLARVLFIGLGIAGAWLGRLLHGGTGSIVSFCFSLVSQEQRDSSSAPKPEPNNGNQSNKQRSESKLVRRVSCPQCEQNLKIPANDRNVVVTCPECKNRFDVSPSPSPEENNLMQFPPNKKTLTTIFKGLLIAEISIVAITLPTLWIESRIIQEHGLVIDDADSNIFVDAIYGLIFFITIPVAITCWVGLFRFRSWARWLYAGLFVFANLIFIPISCFQLTVNWGVTTFVSDLGSYITGAILAMIFLSSLAVEFDSSQSSEPS